MSLSLSERKTLATQSRTLSLSQLRVKVKAGDKWLIAGTTGTGKSTFLRRLIKSWERLYPTSRIYILDSNYRGDFDDFPNIIQTDRECPPKPGANERYQVWQPVFIDAGEVEEWLWGIRKDPPAFLSIDELITLMTGEYSKAHPSEELQRLLKLGRALPVGLGYGTQGLVKVPNDIIGQATHVVRFRLLLPYDQYITSSLLQKKVGEPEDDHGFWYGPNRGNPLYFSSVEKFL